MQVKDKTLVWKTYAIWASWVGLTFIVVYLTCNWLPANKLLKPYTEIQDGTSRLLKTIDYR